MSGPPEVGVDAALARLILEQRVATHRAHLDRAVGELRARVRRAGALGRAVRSRPMACLAAAFGLGLAIALARRSKRS